MVDDRVIKEQDLLYIPTRQCTLHGGLVHGFRRYSARFPVNSALLFRYLYPCSY